MPFFLALEEEIIKSELAGKSILIKMDANSKFGPQMILGDKHCLTENGKLLAGINIHIGKKTKEFPALKVHGKQMEQSKQETYLGDVIDKSGTIRPNIDIRKAKGFGIVSNILAIVNEVPLGHWKIEAGLRLRQAMFINGILFNSEAWHRVSRKISTSLIKLMRLC